MIKVKGLMRSLPVDLSSEEFSWAHSGEEGSLDDLPFEYLSCGDFTECPYKDVGAR